MGSTFTVTLPIRALGESAQSRMAAGDEASAIPRGRLSGTEILIVDDDREAREMVRMALQQAGARVSAVDSAAAALDFLGKNRPALVLTDLAMPGMDGYALVHEIRSRPELSGVKIAALTAFPARRTPPRESGLAAYFMKPIDPFDLVERIARELA